MKTIIVLLAACSFSSCVLFNCSNRIVLNPDDEKADSISYLLLYPGKEGAGEMKIVASGDSWELYLAREVTIPVLAFPLDENGILYKYPLGSVWNSLVRTHPSCRLTRKGGAAAWNIFRFIEKTGVFPGKEAIKIAEKSEITENPWQLDWDKILNDLCEESVYQSSFREPDTFRLDDDGIFSCSANPLDKRESAFCLTEGLHRFYTSDYQQYKEIYVFSDGSIAEWPVRETVSEFIDLPEFPIR